MISRVAAALWRRSPAELMTAVSRRLRGESPALAPVGPDSDYGEWLLDQVYEFVSSSCPAYVLPRERFRALMQEYQDPAHLRRFNRYLGDLWYLFEPDFQTRLHEYYRSQDLPLMMTLVAYARNASMLRDHYLRPYELALGRFGALSILEYGAGVPHGFLNAVHARGTDFCRELTSVDIDGTPARFLETFCRSRKIPHRRIQAIAGESVSFSGSELFDFIFAKDVFEHLLDPEFAVEQILARAGPQTILALDLDDKGTVTYQHVSPALEPLKYRVQKAGFSMMERTGNLSVFSKTP